MCDLPLPAIERELLQLLPDLNLRTTLSRAGRIGELLTAARDQVPHGHWSDWLARIGLNRKTASDYMLAFRGLEFVRPVGQMGLRAFLESLRRGHQQDKALRQCWETDPEVFRWLNKVFNFTVDACADGNNHLCDRYWSAEDSCLTKDWTQETVFCNPPYSMLAEVLPLAKTAKTAVVLCPTTSLPTRYLSNNQPDALAIPPRAIRFTPPKALLTTAHNTAPNLGPRPAMTCCRRLAIARPPSFLAVPSGWPLPPSSLNRVGLATCSTAACSVATGGVAGACSSDFLRAIVVSLKNLDSSTRHTD